MSYMGRLEESRRLLVAGEFLAAEQLYWQARSDWESSRVLAPITEKAVEPFLRWGGSLFGRDPAKPALATFPEREERLRADLREVGELLASEAIECARRPSGEISPEAVVSLGRALELRRDSQFFRLAGEDLWPVTRRYLQAAVESGVPLRVEALPDEMSLGVEDLIWLVEWSQAQVRAGLPELRAMGPWLLRRLETDLIRRDAAYGGQAWALACRLALLDPLQAPRALEFGTMALDGPLPPGEFSALLSVVTQLTCNQRQLAVPMVETRRLQELDNHARRHSLEWPPPAVASLLQRRGSARPDRLSVLVWNEEEHRLLGLRLDGEAPCDACVLIVRDEDVPFAAPPVLARQMIDEWLHAEAPVLMPAMPPAWLAGLLGDRAILDLSQIEGSLPQRKSAPPPEEPTVAHPLFDSQDALATPWQPLLREARSLVPRLLARIGTPAFVSEWGVSNLESLGRAGVGLAAALARCLRALDRVRPEEPGPVLQRVAGAVDLAWPRLQERPWPRGKPARVPHGTIHADTLISHRPDAAELAGYAAVAAPSEVLADGGARSRRVAAAAATVVDPRRVTLAPAHGLCPEVLLETMEQWMSAAIADGARGGDVLWLYAALATCPEGDARRWLAEGGAEAARAQIEGMARLVGGQCSPGCRLEECFETQLEERRAHGLVWVEDLTTAPPSDGRSATVVIDDLVHQVARCEEAVVEEALGQILDRVAQARIALVFAQAEHFARALRRELEAKLPEGRPLSLADQGAIVPLKFHQVPAGYESDSVLLDAEADALTTARVEHWLQQRPQAALWTPLGVAANRWLRRDSGAAAVRGGASEEAEFNSVIVPRIAGADMPDPLRVLLRLAAAASHARTELICLDPRLAHWTPDHDALLPLVAENEASRTGAQLLAAVPARELPQWRQSLSVDRLQRIETMVASTQRASSPERTALTTLLAEWSRARRMVVGGVSLAGRAVTALTIARIAAEAGDEGPLAVRVVAWVDKTLPEGWDRAGLRADSLDQRETSLESRLLAADRGQVSLLAVPPSCLSDPGFLRWAKRKPDVLWCVPQAERALADHPLTDGTWQSTWLARLAECAENSGAPVLAFADDDRAGAGTWTRELASILNAQARNLDLSARQAWSWQREILQSPSWHCDGCGSQSELDHVHQLCLNCGRPVLAGVGQELSASLVQQIARWIRQHGPHHPWVVVARDRTEAVRLERELGVGTQETPLLEADRGSFLQRVVAANDLWTTSVADAPLLFPSIPAGSDAIMAVLDRARVQGHPGGTVTVLDHPLQWVEPAETITSSGVSLLVTRAELEYQAREAYGAMVRALRTEWRRDWSGGLGPHADLGRDPHLGPLMSALDQWRGAPEEAKTVLEEAPERHARILHEAHAFVAWAIERLQPEPGVNIEPLVSRPQRRALDLFVTWLRDHQWVQSVTRSEPRAAAWIQPPS